MNPKKHKPLLLALSSREKPGTLEFNREFTKLSETTWGKDVIGKYLLQFSLHTRIINIITCWIS